jgi:4-carboxymuconolactone decarboxylase
MRVAVGMIAAALCLACSTVNAGERFPELQIDQMTLEQKKVADALMTGPRKALIGPFNTWLRSPDLAARLERVGEYIRFGNSLKPHLRELAILINAREWTAQFEWYAHLPIALKAGLDPRIAAEIAAGKRPADLKDDEKAVYDFCTELHRTRTVTEATYAAALATIGEQGIVDLIGVSGYYDIVSMTLNVAQVPLPPGETPPLPLLQKP